MKKELFILSAVFCIPLGAATAQINNTCGDNCTYEKIENGVDKDGNITYTLKISPIDATIPASIKNYERKGYENKDGYEWYIGTHESAPWASDKTITNVEISEGITSIGDHAFTGMSSVKEVSLPQGLESIGNVVFRGTNITDLTLPDSLKSLGGYSLSAATLESINGLPEGLTFLGKAVFSGTGINELNIPDSLFKNDSEIYDNALHTSNITKLYCSKQNQKQCEDFIERAKNNNASQNLSAEFYEIDGNQIFYDNKWYNSLGDIQSGNYMKKRIYTVGEANSVTGKKNSIKIRYK